MATRPSPGARVAGWLGLAAHVALLPFYAASGLLAPMWAIVILLIVWAALFVVAIWLLRTRPLLTPLVPAFAAVFWFLAISAGEAWLGWTG
ncbi:MAG TPA: hypothetical protein VFR67_01180 [Pilimelia sp.]|nr:hypothetical protein [Pilimelia sp.]